MAYPLTHDDRLPRYLKLRDQLLARIVAREWRAGEAIPPEVELVKQYGLSVGTVRKAVEVLVAEGVLDRIQGKGTFVRRPSFDASLFRFFRFQSGAGERRIPESRILTREAMKAPSAVAQKLRLAEDAPAIRLSRLRLIDGNPMLAEEIWLPAERFGALLELDTGEFGNLLYPLYEERCRQVVAHARECLSVELVGRQYARLLRVEPGTPVVVIERLALGYDEQPLEWRRSRGPAEQFNYCVDIR